LQEGKVRTGEDIGAGWIDTTEESIERAKGLAELNDLLTQAIVIFVAGAQIPAIPTLARPRAKSS
jgi:hypothetical protein